MCPRSINVVWIGLLAALLAVTVRADPRFAHPEIQSFREEYQARAQALEERLHQQLVQHLEAHRPAAEERVRAANLTRNARQIMIAREGRSYLDDLVERVRKDPAADWSDDYRPELREWIEEWRTSFDALKLNHDRERETLKERAVAHLARVWHEQTRETLSPERRRTLFEDFIGHQPPVAPLPEHRAEAVESPAPEPAASEVVDSYFARSVTDEAPDWVWVAVGQWESVMQGVDVVRIPVLEQTHPVRAQQMNIHTRREATMQYTPFAVLPERADYRYRLKHVEGREAVDVLEWPSSRNQWHLVVRTPRGDRAQQNAGFVVEVALPGLDLAAALEQSGRMLEQARPDAGGGVEVAIVSDPALAMIYLNGRPYMGPRGPVATPYTVRMPAGRNEIRLRHRYYQDWVVSNYVPRADASINAQMELRDDMPWTETRFSPRRDWQESGIILQAGDTLFIEAEGRWQIGARREFTGPEGYDPGGFAHYYSGPELRLTPNAPYGALLVRLGYRAETNFFRAVHGTTHRHDFGVHVFLDVNEAHDPELRRDNRGAITVRTAVVNPRTFPQGP